MGEWHVLYVMGGKEKDVCMFLEKNDFDAFYPMKKMVYNKKGIRTLVDKPMFPNYIFIDTELDHVSFSAEIGKLKYLKDGIVKEVKYDNEGTPALHESEKVFLEHLMGKDRCVDQSIGYIENDHVVVTDGPLMGLESNIKHIDRHKRIATIEMMMLGQVREVKVSLEIISKN